MAIRLGALKVAAKDQVTVDGALSVADGGDITLFGPDVEINGDLTARGGSINAGNVLNQFNPLKAGDGRRHGPGRRFECECRGRRQARHPWPLEQLLLDPADSTSLAYLNGGRSRCAAAATSISGAGSLVDVSSGGAPWLDGKLSGGKGGDVTLGGASGPWRLERRHCAAMASTAAARWRCRRARCRSATAPMRWTATRCNWPATFQQGFLGLRPDRQRGAARHRRHASGCEHAGLPFGRCRSDHASGSDPPRRWSCGRRRCTRKTRPRAC